MKGAGKTGQTAGKGVPTELECHRCGESHFARDCPNPDQRIAGPGKGQRSVYADIANANREAKGGTKGYGGKGAKGKAKAGTKGEKGKGKGKGQVLDQSHKKFWLCACKRVVPPSPLTPDVE